MNDKFGAGGFDTTMGPSSGVLAKSKIEGILPMTIKQIYECSESGLRLYNMVFGYVNLVAIVRIIDYSPTKISFKLEDHTGDINGHFWLEDGDADNAPNVVLNTYAKVFGCVQNLAGIKTLFIFEIQSVIDPNVLQVAEQFTINNPPEVYGDFRMDVGCKNRLGLPAKESKIYTAIWKDQSPSGISFQELEMMFPNILHNELRKIVDFMLEEGFVYSSVDSYHFKCSEC